MRRGLASFNEPKGYTMQAKYYALTALVSAAFAMSAQAQSSYSGSTPSQVNTPSPTETQSGQVPATQPSTIIVVPATQPTAVVVEEKRAPGVGAPAMRDEVRSDTLAEMKAGLPRGEQSTPSHGSKPQFVGSEMMWHRDQISITR